VSVKGKMCTLSRQRLTVGNEEHGALKQSGSTQKVCTMAFIAARTFFGLALL
jgi:hypothetical protein